MLPKHFIRLVQNSEILYANLTPKYFIRLVQKNIH